MSTATPSAAAAGFRQRIEGHVKSGKSKAEAVRQAVIDDPDGHQAYVEETTAENDPRNVLNGRRRS